MTDIVLKDLDPGLLDRLQRLAEGQGWPMPQTLAHVVEQGVAVCEAAVALRLNEREENVLQSAINAMEGVADDPGFALIGRPLPREGVGLWTHRAWSSPVAYRHTRRRSSLPRTPTGPTRHTPWR